MPKEEKSAENGQKIQLSLAALMFFSPLVQNIIKKESMELQEKDKIFIKGYIRLGYLALILLVIILLCGIINYRLESSLIDRIYTIGIIALTSILVIGTIGIVTDTNIISGKKGLIDLYQGHITIDKKEILLSYTPIYNIYLRYSQHNFEKPNILIKESIMARIIFIILGFIATPFITSIFLILIMIRIASLMGGIDIINPETKLWINKLFSKNPEELRGYIKGTAIFLYEKTINQKESKKSTDFITTAKEEFSLLYNVQLHNSTTIKAQYLLGLILAILLIRQNNTDLTQRTISIPLIIVLGRYLVMLFKRHHLPPLPLCKEITDLAIYLYEKSKPHYEKLKENFTNK